MKKSCYVYIDNLEILWRIMKFLDAIGYIYENKCWAEEVRYVKCWENKDGTLLAAGYAHQQAVRKDDVNCEDNIEHFIEEAFQISNFRENIHMQEYGDKIYMILGGEMLVQSGKYNFHEATAMEVFELVNNSYEITGLTKFDKTTSVWELVRTKQES